MSMHPSSPQPINPISVGDVVSAGVRIYRDRFKLYYRLAFIGYLWILVPIYGWAKFSAISGLLSRLAFCELIERPETVDEARRHVMPRMWSFFGAGLLVGLIFLGVAFGFTIVFGILVGVAATLTQQGSTAIAIVIWLLILVAFIAFMIGYIRLIARLFIVEVPLAIEENVTATSTISRSMKLTEKFASRLQWIIVVAFLVTLPVSIVVQIVSSIFEGILRAAFPPDDPTFTVLYVLVVLATSFVSGSLLIPFWQAIKAIIYCDLRSRREGLGLEIRDAR